MKKIYLFLLFLPLLSCNDWLDISPENSVTLTNYFQSEADLESLHTSMMARMKSACKGKQPYYYMSVDADELKPNISGFRELDVATHTTQTLIGGILKSTWRDHYSLISLADLMIDNEYRFQNIPAERAAFWLRQAHFVKAITYFRIAQIWGDAPISPGSESLIALAKKPALEVLQYAAGEAEQALGLPAHDKMTDADGGKGVFADKFAHDDAVGGVISELEQVAQHQRDGEFDQKGRDGSGRHVFCHGFLLFSFLYYVLACAEHGQCRTAFAVCDKLGRCVKGGTCAGGGRDGIGAQDPLRRPDGIGGGDGSDVVHYIGVVVAGNEAEADVRDAMRAGEAAAQGLTLVRLYCNDADVIRPRLDRFAHAGDGAAAAHADDDAVHDAGDNAIFFISG